MPSPGEDWVCPKAHSWEGAVVPSRNGGSVTFALPGSNRTKQVWWFRPGVRGRLNAAQVYYMPGRDAIGLSRAPVSPKTPDWALPGLCR
ncbi:hypothetical protein MPNT_200038 [Candidatus Methylacidithermus pantelleriae]|uniref:Uncharacterized protein n=1 Tax=Candidatus Methylacidithermus pantelleriae TaxID=2744239 RepID=A0A8J2BLP2_9BACT|nr:hypothetical protein MPNT_200038 [Candidatus Methylacidithermus pantelleriae]